MRSLGRALTVYLVSLYKQDVRTQKENPVRMQGEEGCLQVKPWEMQSC